MNVRWGVVGQFGGIALALFLLLVGATAILGGTAIPGWVTGALALLAGLLILIGR